MTSIRAPVRSKPYLSKEMKYLKKSQIITFFVQAPRRPMLCGVERAFEAGVYLMNGGILAGYIDSK
jgi:hypothetical protein